VLNARGTELEQGFAFGVVRQLFEPLLTRDRARLRRLLNGAARVAAPVFALPEGGERATSADARHAVLHGLYWLAVNAAGERPTMLCVDDAHWADAPSLRAIAYVVNHMADLPLLVLLGMRPFEPDAEHDLLDGIAADPKSQPVRLRPLSEAAVGALIHEARGDDAAPEFVRACWTVTRGNPFFLREVLAVLDAEDLAATADNAGRVDEIAPRTIARSVQRRLSDLPTEARSLCEALAVLGSGAEPSVAAALAGIGEAEAMAAAERLRRADLLSEGTLEFVHPVVRSVISAELPAEIAPRRHAEAARLLADRGADDAAVSAHLLATAPSADAQTVETLRRAAARARTQGAPEAATRYLHRALAEPAPKARQAELLLELGLAETDASGTVGFDYLRDALRAADTPQEHARIALEFARVLFSYAEFAQTAEVVEQARVRLGDRDYELAAQLDGWLLGAAFWDLSVYTRMSEQLSELAETAPRADDPLLLATASALRVTQAEPASHGAELARRALLSAGPAAREMPLLLAAASTLLVADQPEEAARVWDGAIAEARRRASLSSVGFALTARAHCLIRLGRITDAESDARWVLERLQDDAPVYAPAAIPPLIQALCEQGDFDAGARLLDEFEVSEDLPQIMPINYMLESAAHVRLGQGRTDEAIALLRECGRRLSTWGVRNPAVVPWRSDLALALWQAAERVEALELVGEEVELARAFGVPRSLGMALRAAGLIENGERGLEHLREAVEVLQPTAATLEYARALTDLGAGLRRRGRANARGPLRHGVDLAQRCGATALANRARTELVATGARPRRLLLSGVGSLTAGEHRVAQLAAEGMTNRKIAQALFITEKTVEGHLHHAYRKLDVSSRCELPRVLGRREGHAADTVPTPADADATAN
jgi:DNA-binding CsgD family transcriptional regulator